jgi:hypothetical protein
MTAATPPSPEVCPLCGQANQCAMEKERMTGQKQGPCWCTQASFSAELLSRLPDDAVNRACICARCASGQDDLRVSPR